MMDQVPKMLPMMILHLYLYLTQVEKDINSFVRSKWQTLWDLAVNNKIHAIQPSLGRWPGSRRNTRREEVVLARIHLGHVSDT